MELRHLRALVVLSEERNVTRAAERLHRVQQAVSAQLRQLEEELGVPLFTRSPRGLVPTPAGVALSERARDILRSVDEATAWARAVARGGARALRVAPPDTAASLRVFNALTAALRHRHADLVLSYASVPWLEQPRAVRDGALDLALCFNVGNAIYPRGVEFRRLVDDPGEWALLAERSPLLRGRTVALEKLRDLPVVLYPQDLSPALHAAQLDGLRRAGGRDLRIASGLHSFVEAAQHVGAGAAWMLVFGSVAAEPPPGTRAVRIEGLRMPAGFDVLWRSGNADPLVREAVTLVRTCARAFHARPRRRPRRPPRREPARPRSPASRRRDRTR